MDIDVAELKKAYRDILKVCVKHSHVSGDNRAVGDIKTMISAANNHLLVIEWYEKYGLRVDHDCKPYSLNYIDLDNYMVFCCYGDAAKDKANGSGRYISWSDDRTQPKNEWLFEIGYSTGAYIFGEDSKGQTQLFQDFITEIKTYAPDYSDSYNGKFYWKLKNAKSIYKSFDKMLRKYRKRNIEELKQRKINKMKEELLELGKVIILPILGK